MLCAVQWLNSLSCIQNSKFNIPPEAVRAAPNFSKLANARAAFNFAFGYASQGCAIFLQAR